jgi:hypothetical protein
MRVLIFTLSIFLCYGLNSQDNLKLLKRTGDPDLYQASGLSQTFSGQLMENGQLYFKTTVSSFDDHFWVTDGTSSGTYKVFDDDEINRFETYVYASDGIYIIDKDGDYALYFYNIENSQLNKIDDLGDFKFFEVTKTDDSKDLLFGYNTENDQAAVWITDRSEAGTYPLGDVGENHFSLKFSGSSYGAAIYNTNPWVDFEPKFINLESEEITPLIDFLAEYKTLDEIKRVYIHDHIMILGVVEDGWLRNYLFDLASNTFYESTFIDEVRKVFSYGENDLYVFTTNDLIYINKSTFENQELFGDVYPFSPFYVDENRLYFVNDQGWSYETNHIFYVNMDDQSFHELEGTDIGESYYGCQMAIFQNDLYYLELNRPDILLWKYDLQAKEKTFVDTVSVNSGSYTINNGMQKIGNNLIVSRYERDEGHELYYLDWTSGTLQPFREELSVEIVPNPASDYLEFRDIQKGNYSVQIFDLNGKEVIKLASDQNRLDISTLGPGNYAGKLVQNDKFYTFRFLKI